MKKIVFSVSLILATFTSNSQIVVSEIEKDVLYQTPANVHQLMKYKSEDFTQYYFFFKDMQYQQITDYKSFSLSDSSEVATFFNLFTQVMDSAKEITLTLGEEMILIKPQGKNAVVVFAEGGYFYFNRKQTQALLTSLK